MGSLWGRPEFIDIAILYALINFIGTIAILKLFSENKTRKTKMDTLINLISFTFIFIGSITILVGSLGLLRLPDVFSRIHAVGMIDTAGIGFIIFGLLIYSGFTIVSIKLLILGFVLKQKVF